ncbi:MAG: hypothetical protein CMJ19_04975 [Phycisphaeraceae bacterium]|nr:hypothetical protein [Phycisphaeraceae bacterium]
MCVHSQIVDLDELTLLCRDRRARNYISEAIACYKANAFRSGIVACWLAVVFDILHKLSELEMAGDLNAKSKLDDFEKIIQGGESMLKEALDFERQILDMVANEFEMLTPNELDDLKRLQHDRNRCAHPSMHALGDPYTPTGELTRYHIRNAVEILLSRAPVQGKSAFERIHNEVESEYFPHEISDAVRHFSSGPLVRARKSLIRSLLIGFIKAYLKDKKIKSSERLRISVAIGAIIQMHRSYSENILQSELLKIMNDLTDHQYELALALCSRVPECWTYSGVAAQGKISRYLQSESLKDEARLRALAKGLLIPSLEDVTKKQIDLLDESSLGRLLSNTKLLDKLNYLTPKIIQGLQTECKSFRSSERYIQDLVLPLAPKLSLEDIRQIINVCKINDQVHDAGKVPKLLAQLFNKTDHIRSESIQVWTDFATWLVEEDGSGRLSTNYDVLFENLKASGITIPK